MTRRMRVPSALVAAWIGAAATIAPAPLRGQSAPDAAVRAQAAELARARALVEAGQGGTARVLLDSLVSAAPEASPALGEALYWRGLLAADVGTSERDWKRLLLEVPLSLRAEDALLRLAQLAIVRGTPADARPYLERLARDHAGAASQARAHYWLARSWFASEDAPQACGALAVATDVAPADAVELRAQARDLAARCRGVTPIAPATRVATATDARGASVTGASATGAPTTGATATGANVTGAATTGATAAPSRPPATSSPAAARGRYSVQLAAYNTRAQADALVRRLATRGIEARVDGAEKPFRVRAGYFATPAAAAAQLAEYKRRGMDGFVAEVQP